MAKSKFLKTFKERGFLHQCTDEGALDNILHKAEKSGEGVPIYIGFDCTATSLHVGSLLQIMILRMLQECGHKPIVLLGGATTKIGDPSGKDESRPVLTDAAIEKNLAGIKSVIEKFLDFEKKYDAKTTKAFFVNNEEWISKLSLMGMMEFAAHFSVNRMLTFDSVKMRLERDKEMSLLEFNYMIYQAIDFVELNKNYGCRLQIGGSDQWGNIVNGVDLQRRIKKKLILDDMLGVKGKEAHEERIRRERGFDEKESLFGLTTPLITTSSGAKMGKTADGAVWLSEEKVLASDYWQFWRNTEDADVGRFLRIFTELKIDEIEKLEALEGAAINEAKIILANEATKICHGDNAAKLAAETAKKVFEEGGAGDALPEFEIAKAELEAGIPAFKLFVHAELAESNKAAKRLVQGGGARINDEKVADEGQMVTADAVNSDGIIKLSAGKKKHALVRMV